MPSKDAVVGVVICGLCAIVLVLGVIGLVVVFGG